MIQIDRQLTPQHLVPKIQQLFSLSAHKILQLQKSWNPSKGTPVVTAGGTYTSRGWTEWTQGFQFGSALLQYDTTDEQQFLALGRQNTLNYMATHLTHVGVHDHGFNNISTYGNLLRLILAKRILEDPWEKHFYELALKVSGAVQAARWMSLPEGLGYIYSFNGPHSLFADTIRSLRSLAVAYQLGHVLMGERDQKLNLLHRLLTHAETTARFNVYFGNGRDAYDVRGRVAQESIFNIHDGSYRCPSSQQGCSPFSTWTRGLAWILLGYAEELEFLETLPLAAFKPRWDKKRVIKRFLDVAGAVADYFIQETPTDGVPYWDTGAPGLVHMGDYRNRPANPFNEYEPVDSSAAVIAAQGFVRLGKYQLATGDKKSGHRYFSAGLTIARTVFDEPYLSTNQHHQGLILHSIYHRPKGWDYIPSKSKIPRGESSMWGDYHARELGLLILRIAQGKPYYRFW
jgi:hypothetical protein